MTEHKDLETLCRTSPEWAASCIGFLKAERTALSTAISSAISILKTDLHVSRAENARAVLEAALEEPDNNRDEKQSVDTTTMSGRDFIQMGYGDDD